MIQAVMLMSLGFFAATLLALLIAPAAWARAVRLTSHRIRASLPINETEIRAEKDQLRASHAVTVHQLEKKIDRAEMSAARQRVELNRRDAKIVELEEDAVKVSALLDENRNARHVLSQTLNERLPRAEERLQETRQLLKARDSQIVKFVRAATAQHTTLTHANDLIAQQEQDLKRLNAALMARQYAARQRVPTETLEQTAALQSQVSELRDRAASQSRLIERIQDAGRAKFEVEETAPAEIADVTAPAGSAPPDETSQDAPKGFAQKFNRFRAALTREKDTTARLRAELASAHDRAAKISSHYRDELRSLSQSGAVPVPLPDSYADDIALRDAGESEEKASLLERAGVTASANGNGATGHDDEDSPAKDAPSGDEPDAAQKEAKGKRLTDRLKENAKVKKSENGEKESTPAAALTPSSQQSANSGTLLQRLKGIEEG